MLFWDIWLAMVLGWTLICLLGYTKENLRRDEMVRKTQRSLPSWYFTTKETRDENE